MLEHDDQFTDFGRSGSKRSGPTPIAVSVVTTTVLMAIIERR